VKRVLLCFLFLSVLTGFATHNRAGEILYKRIAPFTAVAGGITVQVYNYAFTIIKYTNDGPNIADRCEDTLYFGDGSRGVAKRVNGPVGGCQCQQTPCGEIIINETSGYRVKKNIYTINHTYAGPGTYRVYSLDPNRNEGVHNIPGSVNLPFYIESLLIINSFTGANTSPTFSFDPIDRACKDRCFTHNPGAFDIDGDSLSYEISTSKGEDGGTIPGYFFPETGGGTYGINAVSGILTWCTPQLIDEYNLAFIVKEWRKNTSGTYQMVGYVLRDMQVIVQQCLNNPPTITPRPDTCVEAGTFINKPVLVTDPENQFVTLSGAGGAFSAQNPATLNSTSGVTPYYASFTWQTDCGHIRQQPYGCVFKAEDAGTPKLTSFAVYNIRVVPPSVKNVTAVAQGSAIKITWSASPCNPSNNPITAYKIYRKDNCDPIVYDPCKTGVSASMGYSYIGETSSGSTTYVDNNGGNGLVVGQDYNYLVVVVYADGSESFASTQVCAKLKRDVPILLNVDVLSTSTATGSVYVRWTRPLTTPGNLDIIALPGPYAFNLKHRTSATGTYSTVFTDTDNNLALLDTQFVHTAINTENSGHEYLIEFIAGTVTVGNSQKATSVFLTAEPGDRKIDLRWSSTTPWNNYKYTVYRKDPGSVTFSVIATTTLTAHTDKNNVANRATYCYKILSEGKYSDTSIFRPLLNNSQELCATAVDDTPPCAPTITITADCPLGFVKVEWNNVRLSCGEDAVKYDLFRKETLSEEYSRIATINTPSNTSFTFDGLNLINSCFAIQATDSSGNVSALSNDYCVDNCPEFELPNIITLNGDGTNDFFKAIKVRQIKEIDLYVFDRWGNLVYKTTDPYFKWDGKSVISNLTVSEGTFFYICDVFMPSINGIQKRNLKGYLQVIH
jgi:gliding motility-associated-like protein